MFAQAQARIAAGAFALAVAGALTPGAGAQTLNPMPTKPVVDANGVDLVNWTYSFELSPISIGPADQDPIKLSVNYPTERDSFYSSLIIRDPSWQASTRATATIGSKTWSILGGGVVTEPMTYISYDMDSAVLHDRDGTLVEYAYPPGYFAGQSEEASMCAAKITRPNGEVLTYYNKETVLGCRTQSIVSNRGYQIKYEYNHSGWVTSRSKIILINNAYEYCNPTADNCTLTMPWPSVNLPATATNGVRTYTNHMGQSWAMAANSMLSPGETAPSVQWTTQTYVPANVDGSYAWRVTSMTRGGQTWTYSYPSSDPILGGVSGELLRIQDPAGSVTRFRRSWGVSDGNPTTGEYEAPSILVSTGDEFNQVTKYTYNAQWQLASVELPEGNKHIATYNSNGDLATYTLQPKAGSGLSNLVTSASYTVCCDKPDSTTDARNNTIAYTYHPTNGRVLTETMPPDSSGLQAVKRYAYSQRYAWVKNSGGGYSQAATPIWVLDSEKTCRTSATVSGSCSAGAADEVTITYDYGPNSGPNNLWVRGKVVTANGVGLRACYRYDAIGNKISETSPRAGLTSCP